MHGAADADDLLCAGLKPENPRAYFGIDRLPSDQTECHNLVRDITACPQCGGKLSWEFVRYHHIGRAHCPACGFHSPEAQYRASKIDGEHHRMTVTFGGKEREFPLPNQATINVYNSLSAIALLSEFGLAPEEIAASMDKLSISATRYSEEEVNGRKVILHLAKGQNPIACSRAFENIRDYPGKKAVILFLDDYFDAAHSVENTAWLFDTDFEFLRDESIVQVIAAGARHWDVALRLLLAELPKEKLSHLRENEAAAGELRAENADAVFILYDVYTIGLANHVKEQVKEILAGLPEKKEEPSHAD